MKARQLALIPQSSSTEHGGDVRRGKRKIRRPIVTKTPMHVTFRSTRARGAWSFTSGVNRIRVSELAYETAQRFNVHLYGFENVGNHVHLVLRVKHRRDLQAFLRVFGQRLMFLITGACKGNPVGRFFDAVAYSRVVSWGRDFNNLKQYLFKNRLESLGVSTRTAKNWRGIEISQV